ncbi:PLDc N-terminal domain-containing protein [Cryobacterium sp. GrIS_2_6]|uniref:PLD nuclease N-terminal domain-containing protein n=1 Tax=Cryobacterium sp. GrIS_2_6 TaxID=3162785 RepID=UPI002DFB5431|nr:hypothetical protein [Cryobacterium psychrotolerans]
MTQARNKIAKRSARKRGWNDLSPREQTGVLVAGSVQLALAATAWAELAKRPAALVNGPKLLWAAIIGMNFIGPIAYFVCGRRKSPATGPVPAAVTEPATPLAPAEPDASPTPALTPSEAASVPPVVDEGEPGPVPGLA